MRIAWILPPCVCMVVVCGVAAAQADGGWFSGTSTTETKPISPLTHTTVKKEPSALEKVGSGTKKFFSNIGSALSPSKKPAPKKPALNPYASAMTVTKSPPQPEKKSWLSQMFQPKEPDPPRTPSDWIGQKRLDY